MAKSLNFLKTQFSEYSIIFQDMSRNNLPIDSFLAVSVNVFTTFRMALENGEDDVLLA